jgi:hypothetical protein
MWHKCCWNLKIMRTKSLTFFCAATIALASAAPAFASQDPDPTAVAADALFMRPLMLGATAAGGVLFVAYLPFALLSRSVTSTAKILVVAPAKGTFTRPLGDFDYPKDASDSEMAASK